MIIEQNPENQLIHVHDLKIEDEILPFFNFTNNRNSKSRLLALLHNVPATENQILERQAIVQGFLGNWDVLENFTYRRMDLFEVNAHFEDIVNKKFTNEVDQIKSSLKLRLFETERSALRSKLVQIILLISGIQRQYLLRLNKNKFPDSFKKQLQQALFFLTKLRLERNEELINEDQFSVSKMVEFTHLLHQLNPPEIKSFWDFFFTFESYWSIAKGTLKNEFTFPSFSDGTFRIEDFFHPAIKNPVKNTLDLTSRENVLLLTGPNMSGKSTLLKALGTCVYLAHVGLPVPASSCLLPFFNSIAITINSSDNLRDGYSHFMAEIQNLKSVLNATKDSQNCFAVFDEIFRGTNVDDALDITQTTVNGLAKKKGSFFFISTHMLQLDDQLGNNSSENIKKFYIECVLNNGLPTFSYKLREGWSQLKIGRILFENEGLVALLEE